MPKTHRGQEVADNHSNIVQWEKSHRPGEMYGEADVHPDLPGTWSLEVYPNDGGEGTIMSVQKPHWRCEDGSCMDDVGHGVYRTEDRAKRAAEALVKRAVDGRDMQTGRKGYNSGSGGTYTQPERKTGNNK